ncbi:invasion associated locus B family protein [Methylopila musalis]|uniref:Invasion associated locus B family protein n=1 Tax=Methylopila musalis TaxID=1134781 RepID=A0ABW3ZB46_9HYPH
MPFRRAVIAVLIASALPSLAVAQQQPTADQMKAATDRLRQQGQTPAATPPAPADAAKAQAPQQPPETLPNGAAAINETYGDWTVDCRIGEGRKSCLLSQAQGDRQSGRRLFAIELRAPKDGKVEGAVLMPFGLKLDSGAVLTLDDKDFGSGLRFSTCVPAGCLLPISLPATATASLKSGKQLTVGSLNLGDGQLVSFNVSLDGFNAALDRLTALAASK